jgi:hypothetical protein
MEFCLMGSNKPKVFDECYIPEPMSGCYLWLGAPTSNNGYGHFRHNGRSYKAHRYSWIMHRGDIPPGMCVLHKCDTPSCVNIDHLFLGTPADNNRDMAQKGRDRQLSGEANGMAKLIESDVRAILSDPRSLRVIAEDYGLCKSAVSAIKRRKNWRHLSL